MKNIVAVSTPIGTGGIAVLRLSGPNVLEILARAWQGKSPMSFESHTLHLGWINDADDNPIDQVVAAFYKGPDSYTGEDVIEVSCHGSRWVQSALMNRFIECGAVPASAGEFTLRAFENGKMDLAQAEGIADMISASSKAAARMAASQIKGDYSRRLEELRTGLLELATLLELELDFSEEEVEFADRKQLIELTEKTLREVDRLIGSYKAGSVLKNGITVAIAGKPNAGKSTLLNALSGDDKAIVSAIPGTTRDAIEEVVEVDGILFRFVDTAGLRESDDIIEQKGVDKARKKIQNAYITLFLIDPTQDVNLQMELCNELESASTGIFKKVSTKADLDEMDRTCVAELSISAETGKGIEKLKKILVECVTSEYNPETEIIVTNVRHFEALKSARRPLERLLTGLYEGETSDFLAEDLREVVSHIGEITGIIASEEILQTIFSRYCIGK